MPPVVPNANGNYGMDTRAAYGGTGTPTVYRVTKLTDDGSVGTLRWAVTQGDNAIVVFETSGYIDLGGDLIIFTNYLTIAGQTAPSPGITVRGYGLEIRGHDVLFQHFRIRPGTGTCNGSLQIYGGAQHHIVLDHMSFSWGQDENLAFNWTNGQETDATVWRCIMAEGLYRTPGSGGCTGGSFSNGHGLLIDSSAGRVACIQSLFSTNLERNPYMLGDTRTALVNNVQYQTFGPWGFFYNNGSVCGAGCPNIVWHSTVVGNRFIKGPNSLDGSNTCNMFTFSMNGGDSPDVPLNKIYRSDNTIANQDGTVVYEVNQYSYDVSTVSPPAQAPMPTNFAPLASTAVESFVLANAGARPADRDTVDSRIVATVTARGGNFISVPNDVGGYPTLTVNTRSFVIPLNPDVLQVSGYTTLEETLHAAAALVEGTVPVINVPDAIGSINAQDTFTGVAGTAVSAHGLEIGGTWSAQTTSVAGWSLSNLNRLMITTNDALVVTLASATPFSPEYDVSANLVKLTVPGGHSNHLWARASLGAVTGYFVGYDGDASVLSLWLVVNAVYTLLGNASYTIGANDKLQLLVRNDSKSVKVNGVPLIYSTDNTITTKGLAGIGGYATGVADTNTAGIHIDNFLVTDVLSGGVALAGVQASTAAGAVKRSTTMPLSNFGSATALGFVSTNAKAVTLSGVAASTFQGVFGNIITPASLSGAVNLGTFGLTRTKTLAGLATAASLGALVLLPPGAIALTGVSAASTTTGILVPGTTEALTTTLGTATRGSVTLGVNQAALSGVLGTMSQGFISLPGAVSQSLTSVLARGIAEFVIPPIPQGALVASDFLTIAGSEKQMLGGWTITDAINNSGTMRFKITSETGTYVPQLDDEVVFYLNNVRAFAGNITAVLLAGASGEGYTPVTSDITAVDCNALATRRFFGGPGASTSHLSGTLLNVLQHLILYIPGATLDTAQAVGPTLEDVDYVGKKISDILNEMTTRTGYVWEIDYYKTLRMYVPGAYTAPFSILSANSMALGDVTVEPTRKEYANRVIVYGTGIQALAQDNPAIAQFGFWETTFTHDTTDQSAIDHLAAQILAQALPTLKTVRYKTLGVGLQSGMTQTINLPGRGINNTYVITDVTSQYLRNQLSGVSVTATEGLVFKPGWRETIKTWGASQGATTIGGSGTGSPGGTTVAAVRNLVQFGSSGVDATSSPTSGAWVPIAGGMQVIGQSAVQPYISTVLRIGNDAIMTIRARVLDTGNSVIVRLFDVTLGQECLNASGVPAHSAVINTTTWTTVTLGLNLYPGDPHIYEAQLQTSVIGGDAIVVCSLL